MFKRSRYHLPKFEPPQTGSVYARHRMFKKFDGNMDKRLVWLSAPAGSGKTSLIASYLVDRLKKIIWYQVDAADKDIASFFHYMAFCMKKCIP